MPETILITASLRMKAPVDLVRAQYRDIDHHIRRNVHPGIHYQWEQGSPGERKIRTTFRILGVTQYDVSLLEDAPDGSFVIHYIEGTNEGMVLRHEFVPVDGGTDVRLSADAPSTLARKLLGPLFKIGARQVMNKALREDKTDIEGGEYHPGTAAGDLTRALAGVELPKGDSKGAAAAVLAGACLVAAADAEVDQAELDALQALTSKLDVAPAAMQAQVDEVLRLVESGGLADRAVAIGTDLARAGVAEAGITAAAVAALVSHGLALGELEALRAIAKGAGYPDEDLGRLIERVDA